MVSTYRLERAKDKYSHGFLPWSHNINHSQVYYNPLLSIQTKPQTPLAHYHYNPRIIHNADLLNQSVCLHSQSARTNDFSLDIIEHPFSHAKRLFRLSPLAGKNRIHRLKQRSSPVITEPSLSYFGEDRRRPRSSGTYYASSGY